MICFLVKQRKKSEKSNNKKWNYNTRWKETTKKQIPKQKTKHLKQQNKDESKITGERNSKIKLRPTPPPKKKKNTYTHITTRHEKMFSPVFGRHAALKTRLIINSNISSGGFEFMIYLCFFNHNSGLLLQHRRQTQENPRRTKKQLNGEQQKTETQHKYNLNVTCPKLSQMFLWYLMFSLFCSRSFFFLPYFQVDKTRLLCGIKIEIHRQKQNFKNKFQIPGLCVS